MRILIFHGYLLGGTGSNVYNARLAKALLDLGYEVHLLSQERHPEQHPFIDAAGDWDDGALRIRPLAAARPGVSQNPRCVVYRPDIGGLLPVYVHDRYEGLRACTFSKCSDAEVELYVQRNVEAVGEVAARVRPQLALANHLVMGPTILARALGDAVPYAVKVHGSALEYTVKREPQRFVPYAREGILGARGVLVGSRHTAESLWRALGDHWVREHGIVRHTRLGPPGVDVHGFAPRQSRQASSGLRALVRRLQESAADRVAEGSGGASEARTEAPEGSGGASEARTEAPEGSGGASEARTEAPEGRATPQMLTPTTDTPRDAFSRQEARAAAALAELDPEQGPIVAYVGKLILSKGVDLLVAAWPLVLQQVPTARLVIVGFGALDEPLQQLVKDLAARDLAAVEAFARAGRALEGGTRAPLAHLLAFLSSMSERELASYLDASAGVRDARSVGCDATPGLRDATPGLRDARSGGRDPSAGLGRSVHFTGRLDHAELADLLPACEALVVPSTFPEAFGMVAAEAAACGVLPVSAAHSGLAEVSEELAAAVGDPVASWLSFPIDDEAPRAIAQRLVSWLNAEQSTRDAAREAIVATVRRLWSWEGVARGVLCAAEG